MRTLEAGASAAALAVAGLALAVFLAGARPVPAQPDDGGAARDLVARTVKAYDLTEKGDAAGAVAGLLDESWIVRRFVAVRLRTMGLPEEAYAQVAAFAAPGSERPTKDALAPCEKWAKEYKGEASGAAPATRMDALAAITSVIEEEIRRHAREPGVARDLVGALVGLLPGGTTPEERDWIARRTLARLDKAAFLQEAGLAEWPKDAKEAEKACAALAKWYGDNRDYLYAHPGEGRVYVDGAAREKKIPSDTFRKVNQPWGPGEGPNRPATGDGTIR